ncbi:TIGR01440 family protein [Paenibacillus yonginensis]|uniref:TIGR01440 family protein n=1 Tax=Paenibacillus yonginensis TaxID=1462996 RepID=UPI003AAC4889
MIVEPTFQLDQLAGQAAEVLKELAETANLGPGKIVVIGTSTSEIAGQRIGTAGAQQIAAELYRGFEQIRAKYGFELVFQCCEHLNRALVMERAVLERLNLTEVSAVPVRTAGGSMAAEAYLRFAEPCLAESIEAHAGLDIGETLIGMHLRRVAVPLRLSRRYVGQARVNAAMTRPKLIGGERAVYRLPQTEGGELCD